MPCIHPDTGVACKPGDTLCQNNELFVCSLTPDHKDIYWLPTNAPCGGEHLGTASNEPQVSARIAAVRPQFAKPQDVSTVAVPPVRSKRKKKP